MNIEDLVTDATGAHRPNIEVIGIPKKLIPQAKHDAILSRLGLKAEGIAATVQRLVQVG